MDEKQNKESINLQDGSVFAIGGVKSILAQLVEGEKIVGESVVFSIGPSDADQNNSARWSSDNSQDHRRSEGQDERYEIANEIARGGMGSILKAEDRDLRRFVAMKVLLDPGDTNARMYERFIKEAQVTGFLEHPNIIPVHELGVDTNSRPFFTMKLIGGESLASVLKKLRSGNKDYQSKYPIRRLLGILVQVCNAVSFAHSRGVIHRDLKPENIMIGEYGEVLVMDWGLARIRNVEEILAPKNVGDTDNFAKTQEGVVIGTPLYMPPEQATGDIASTDERSDVFSIGAILYEILTGKMLYGGETIGEVINKAANVQFELPSKISKIQSDIEKVCIKALQKNQCDRYQSVNDLSEAIKSYLDHRVIPEYDLKPWQKIVQSLAILIFFVLLLPVVGIVRLKTDMYYILAMIHIPSFVMVISTALLFYAIVFGRPRFRRYPGFPQAKAYGLLILLDGSFWGGILGTMAGYFAMLANLDNAESLGPNMSLALITVLYFFGFLLLVRLESVRDLRINSLFDNIAESSFPNL